uniref:Uncharacterized protein n=1 Tax=Arundo donax TaxID=35708 RepID=A0A0A9CFV0_ARUDO
MFQYHYDLLKSFSLCFRNLTTCVVNAAI